MNNTEQLPEAYVASLTSTLQALPFATLSRIADLLEQARWDGRTVFLLGNGGSAATASHIACDLNKAATQPGVPRLRALALTDNVPLITAWANDTHYHNVFVEQMQNFLRPGDVVVAISGSGRSPNVVDAVLRARELGAMTVGLTGFDGGLLTELTDICLVVPSEHMGQIEDVHLMIGHILTAMLAQRPALQMVQETASGARVP
jgi:D-sedoheptulose 7-phosphate isomerase